MTPMLVRKVTPSNGAVVVSHRPSGRKLTANLHEDTLFGTVPADQTLFTGHKSVVDLEPNHLRKPIPEKPRDAILRLTKRYLKRGLDEKQAKKQAKAAVESPGYVAKLIDPPPGKEWDRPGHRLALPSPQSDRRAIGGTENRQRSGYLYGQGHGADP